MINVNYLKSDCDFKGNKMRQKGREHWRVFEENKEQFVVTLGFDIKNKIYERQ